jgi:hypothetical protein
MPTPFFLQEPADWNSVVFSPMNLPDRGSAFQKCSMPKAVFELDAEF